MRTPWFTSRRARELGVSRRTIEAMPHPHRGVVGHRLPENVREDVAAISLVLPPGSAAAGSLAAWLHGLALPWSWTPGELLDIGRWGGQPCRLATVRPHYLGADVTTVHLPGVSIPVVARPFVFRQLAPVLSRRDLVVLGDTIVGWRSGVDVTDVAATLTSASPGVVAARAALRDVRPGVNSAMESRLRQDFVREGFPEPELNAAIHDERGGLIGYVDFLWRSRRLVVEYNGAHHFATPQQRLEDEARRNRLERLGYRVIVVNRIDYFQHHADTLAGIRRALAEQGERLVV